MNIKLKNKGLISLLLANAILLNQAGCKKSEEYNAGISAPASSICNDLLTEEVIEVIMDSAIEMQKDELKRLRNKLEEVNNNVCSLKEVEIKQKKSDKSKTIKKMEIFQKAKEIGVTKSGWSLIKYDGKKGYVKTKDLSKFGDTYIEVDISEQNMKYYKNNKEKLSTAVVTGKDSTPTVTGLFDVYTKAVDYTMRGIDYTAHADYVLKFYQAYYIHDSNRSYYGGEIYHNNGSHGCVNTPYEKVKQLYNMVDVHTPVLVHK